MTQLTLMPFSMFSRFFRFPASHDEQKIVPSSKQQWLDRGPMKRPNGESVSTASGCDMPTVVFGCLCDGFLLLKYLLFVCLLFFVGCFFKIFLVIVLLFSII